MKISINKDKIYSFSILISCIMFTSYGFSNGTNGMGILSVILCIILMLRGTDEENFCLLVAMIPINNCWIISGTSLRGLMCLVPSIMILKRRRTSVGVNAVLAGFILFLLECINDLPYTSLLSFVNMISPIIYLTLFSSVISNQTESWNLKKIMIIFVISSTIACFGNLIFGGGLSAYYNDISWYRFGQESSDTLLPGAMEIPLFSCISIYMITMFFLFGFADKIWKKVLWIFILGIQIMFGILTVSRVFVVGLLIIGILLFVWMVVSGKGLRIARFIPTILIVLVFFYLKERTLIESLINKMLFRFSTSSTRATNGRSFIWSEVLNYLFSHPKALILGEGIEYYSILGKNKGYTFSAFAHNFYLDIVMGVGIIGFICFTVLFYRLIRRHKKNILSFGVLFIIAGVFMFSGTLNYIRSYIYIMMGIIFMNNFNEQISSYHGDIGKTLLKK